MKKKEEQNLLWLTTLATLLIFWTLMFALQDQAIIDNPENPLNKNAGRIVHLKEILRIKDEGIDFYFKEPWEIDVAEDGSIFVKEFNQTVTRLYRSKTYNQYVYVCHTQDYLIKQFDLEKFQISRIFRRAYARAKFQQDENRPFKFYNDVYRLLIYKGNVWALTSTLDKEKGVLIDVFNEEGEYLDNFYLRLLKSKTGDCFYQLYFPMVIMGDYLYAIEHDEDWIFYVAKYEIIDEG